MPQENRKIISVRKDTFDALDKWCKNEQSWYRETRNGQVTKDQFIVMLLAVWEQTPKSNRESLTNGYRWYRKNTEPQD